MAIPCACTVKPAAGLARTWLITKRSHGYMLSRPLVDVVSPSPSISHRIQHRLHVKSATSADAPSGRRRLQKDPVAWGKLTLRVDSCRSRPFRQPRESAIATAAAHAVVPVRYISGSNIRSAVQQTRLAGDIRCRSKVHAGYQPGA